MNFQGFTSTLLRSAGRPPLIVRISTLPGLLQASLDAGVRAFCTDMEALREPSGKAACEALKTGNNMHFLQTDVAIPVHESSLKARLSHGSVSIDCLNLRANSSHTPSDQIVTAWRTIESHTSNGLPLLGLADVDIASLRLIYSTAMTKPSTVMNRPFTQNQGDREVRAFCQEHSIVYQADLTMMDSLEVSEDHPASQLRSLTGLETTAQAVQALMVGLGAGLVLDVPNEHEVQKTVRSLQQVRNWTYVYAARFRELLAEFQRDLENLK
ncbi:hypothetical protein BT63DRAFT_427314 [Microthyrium microscopicum]|uniref:HpcH/HpaI aldolase/citrate lyase domain-containing protein n=1 Tax=Microthyrium microscopicum TaxID=703497 RepID=A0A6A6U7G6_9PEZI|nr:hypothetical protein BT63DRAFT_427314 [Microthyrium microscopicum]